MPRRNSPDSPIQESHRWPRLFSKPEACQVLLSREEWQYLEADLERWAADLRSRVVHEVPKTIDNMAEQNFQRGYIAAIELVLGLREELEDFMGHTR